MSHPHTSPMATGRVARLFDVPLWVLAERRPERVSRMHAAYRARHR